jgi:hypothetical protein
MSMPRGIMTGRLLRATKFSPTPELPRSRLRDSSTVALEAPSWRLVTWSTSRPLIPDEPLDGDHFEYEFLTLQGDQGVLFVARDGRTIRAALEICGCNPEDPALGPAVDILRMFRESVGYAEVCDTSGTTPAARASTTRHQVVETERRKDTQVPFYYLTGVWAHLETYGDGLRSVGLWGDDVAAVLGQVPHLHELQKELLAYRVSLRLRKNPRQTWMSIGTRGEVSFRYSGTTSLNDVRSAFAELTRGEYISWQRVPSRPADRTQQSAAAARFPDDFYMTG